MNPSAASVYFILGTPGAGRRALVLDLMENGLGPDETALVLIASGEPADPSDAKLASLPRTEVRRWRPGPGISLPEGELGSPTRVFLLADSQADAITQTESLKPWLAHHGAALARIFTVVDCGFAEKHPALAPWFDACIHFSDVVFLTRREGVQNKWLSGFVRRYEEQFFPCHFIPMKKGGLPNPALVLEPQPRRVSQYFDAQEEIPEDLVIETDGEEPEDGDEDAPPVEVYFERNRSGRRVRELPDVRACY
ncbi:MAG: hypothetical protein C0502_01335 [Opitutus sp.]|nr:hypothetical protein [Opitutus sp.]